MKTLLEFIVAVPDWYRGSRLMIPLEPLFGVGGVGVGGVRGVGVVGVGAGAEFWRQTDGCPEQLQLFCSLQPMQPAV